MITRLVKMTFRPEEAARFLELFEGWRHRIIAFPGCEHLELLRDTGQPHIFFTYSVWRTAADLDAYRRSEVFGSVWPVVKRLFLEPAEAWTVERRVAMDREP
jgi:quinol monooxygenase YgiN